jgi:hypothetical protein
MFLRILALGWFSASSGGASALGERRRRWWRHRWRARLLLLHRLLLRRPRLRLQLPQQRGDALLLGVSPLFKSAGCALLAALGCHPCFAILAARSPVELFDFFFAPASDRPSSTTAHETLWKALGNSCLRCASSAARGRHRRYQHLSRAGAAGRGWSRLSARCLFYYGPSRARCEHGESQNACMLLMQTNSMPAHGVVPMLSCCRQQSAEADVEKVNPIAGDAFETESQKLD